MATIEHGKNCSCCDEVGECSECGQHAALQPHDWTNGKFCVTCWERVDAALRQEARENGDTYSGCRCMGDVCRC